MQNTLPFCGYNKTTLLDYPGRVAATIFLGGCNFRCPFCQNGSLVLSCQESVAYTQEEILSFLSSRKGILSGVCITGGEPTLYPVLPDFLRVVKDMGYQIKLDTNGTNPALLTQLIADGLVDFIAMDIKADLPHYAEAAGLAPLSSSTSILSHAFLSEKDPDKVSYLLEAVQKSVELIKHCGLDYEFRTTVVKGIHTADSFRGIAAWLNGSRSYFLQNYVESDNVICPIFSSFSKEELEEFQTICTPYFENVTLRGVE